MYKSETVVVVAHPDDEVLWFGSLLQQADNVVVAFGPYGEVPHLGTARDKAIAELPFRTTFLRLEEAGSYAQADWIRPAKHPLGIALDLAPLSIQTAYEANFNVLVDRLRGLLHAGQSVFSHNPWGEYGHEDHVLVFRAVEKLRHEIGFDHWVSSYVSERSAPLARHWQADIGACSTRSAIDPTFTASVQAIYAKHQCWTWDADWTWPEEEWFFRMDGGINSEPAQVEPRLIHVVRAQA
jgi:LmbE family N-acetylglucosaminyl deacetylase